jgi:hypothetical protein
MSRSSIFTGVKQTGATDAIKLDAASFPGAATTTAGSKTVSVTLTGATDARVCVAKFIRFLTQRLPKCRSKFDNGLRGLV